MEIMNLKEEFVLDIAEIEQECFAEPWSENAFLSDLDNENAIYSVAVIDGKAVGYMGGYAVFDTVYINNVAITGKCRKKGVATAIMQDFLTKCGDKIVTLEVRKGNTPAINLYAKFGFETVGERKGFYKNPKEDALIMTKQR